MPYVFELESEVPSEPFVDNLGTEICEFALGYDVDRDVAIIMSVMLVDGGSYLDGEVEDVFDLRFGIRERDLKHVWKVTAPDYSKEAVEAYVPKEQRDEVILRLLCVLKVLVQHSEAKYLTMESFYPSLPAKALEKYEYICVMLADCGFETSDKFRDQESGKNYWFFSRTD